MRTSYHLKPIVELAPGRITDPDRPESWRSSPLPDLRMNLWIFFPIYLDFLFELLHFLSSLPEPLFLWQVF